MFGLKEKSAGEPGTVKWFDERKGYGFIAPDDGSEDVFVHHSVIEGQEGRRSLVEGQAVRFEAEPAPKGMRAVRVEAEGRS